MLRDFRGEVDPSRLPLTLRTALNRNEDLLLASREELLRWCNYSGEPRAVGHAALAHEPFRWCMGTPLGPRLRTFSSSACAVDSRLDVFDAANGAH